MDRDWLRLLRKDASLTMCQAADQAGISESFYCLIENGNRRPSPEVAQAIAAILNFDWRRFYEDQPKTG